MGKYTQIVIKSREITEYGLPKLLGVYHLGEAHRVGASFIVTLTALREYGIQFPQPGPVQAASADLAREHVITLYRTFAGEAGLDILITELPDLS